MRADEVERVRGLVGAAFLLGTALVLFYGSANAIFLTRYDISALPWVYILNAVVVIAVGLAYGTWSARVPVGTALVGLATAMTLSVAALWVWATVSDDRVVAFVMAMWFRLLFIFAVLGLWEIASAVFDIRQAKRLFAAVALGMMLAFVAGGVATPVLSAVVGTVGLVGVAALCFAWYTVAFRRLLRRYGVGTGSGSVSVAPAGPREIVADRYSRRMVWMKSVTILLLYLTEYVFYEQAAETFATEQSLAGFLGVFMGGMTIVMVVVTGIISGRYISRFGIRVATITLPAAMLLVAVPTGVYGMVAAIDTIFFALVCVVLATDHVLGNAIGEPAGAVLFQPMAPERRMRVRLAVDGWLGSVALVLAGFILLAVEAADLDSVAPLLLVVAGVAVVGVVVAILQYADYVAALRTVTTLAFGDRGPAATGAEEPASVLAAAVVARALERDPLGTMLPGLVGHDDPDVVELALEAIGETSGRERVALVEQVLDRDDLPDAVQSSALRTLAILDASAAERRAAAILAGPRPAIALAPAIAMPSLRAKATQELHHLAISALRDDRLAACRVIERSAHEAFDATPLLVALVADPDPDVVDAALEAAAGRLTDPLVESVVGCLTVAAHRRRALHALASARRDVVRRLDELTGLPDEATADVVRHVLGARLESPEIVRRFLTTASPSVVRRAAYDTIDTDAAGALISDHVAEDLALLEAVVAANASVSGSVPVVADALADEFELARTSIYGALGVAYGRGRLRDIETLVRTGDDDDRANAIEALDVLLDPDHRRTILAALEPLDINDAAPSSRRTTDATPIAFETFRDDPRLTPWTRKVIAQCLDQSTRPDGVPHMDPTVARVLSLRAVDIFSTLSYDTLAELAELVTTHRAPAGAVIIETGAVGRELYAIVDGVVEARTVEGTVSRLEAGTVFGELALLDPAPRSATVVAVTDVELLVVTRATLLALADRRPSVMTEIARVLARRLRATT